MSKRGFLSPVTENFLHAYGVGKVSYELAQKFNVNPETAFIAGSLHDLGGAVPNSDRVEVADSLKIELFEEEREVPMLVHAKLGRYFANTMFGIENPDVLNAILYHTTCIDDPTPLVQIVFLADKIHWDRNGKPPYLDILLDALRISLDEGCKVFIDWLWYSDLYVIHPFLLQSHDWYFRNQSFKKSAQENYQVILNENIKKKYFLNEIADEFQCSFRRGKEASMMAKCNHEDAEKAFLAAALTNLANTISPKQTKIVAQQVGIETDTKTDMQLLPELSCYFAKEEFGITDTEVLNAILHQQQECECKSELCRIVSKVCQDE